MTEKKFKRRKYLVHPSSQLKYIAFSVLPALVMSLYCTYSLMHSGELVLRAAKEKPLVPAYSIRQAVKALEAEGYTKETTKTVAILKRDLDVLAKTLETSYADTLYEWDKTRQIIFVVLIFVMLLVGLMSLVYSHRIAGPIFRLRRCARMLAEGKEVPPISLRKKDEFKDLAASLEQLRVTLKENGMLKPE